MLYETVARRFIGIGCFATALIGFDGVGGACKFHDRQTTLNAYMTLIVGLLFFGLAYGVHRASRICAIVATIFFVGLMAYDHRDAGGYWSFELTFGSLFLLGIIGCFMWHSRQIRAPLSD